MSGGKYAPTKTPERACLKVADWPEPDRRRWQTALQPVDPLDPFLAEGGERSQHKPHSNRKAEKGYGRYLTFLRGQNSVLDSESPADRITRERTTVYVDELIRQGCASRTILARLQELGEVAVVFGPDRDWSFVKHAASRIRAHDRPARDKRSRLVQSDELLDLGLRLIEEAPSASTARKAAVIFRDGFLIAFLALRPLRRKNLATLTIGQHLRKGAGGWWISISADETKTGAAFEAPFPPLLEPVIEQYLARHRPHLVALTGRWAADPGHALWISSDGSPMTEMAIYDRVRQHTQERLGKALNPHLFRDCAATTVAIHDPGHVRTASTLLGHRSQQTMERHYQHAQTLQAHRHYTRTLSRVRRGPQS